MVILGVMIGGALGALARYGTTLLLQGAPGAAYAGFPWATLAVNVVGSFLLAVVATLGPNGTISPQLRTTLAAGFIGSFTTFSTFELESNELFRDGRGLWGVLYVMGNLVLGYGAVLLGRAVAVRWVG